VLTLVEVVGEKMVVVVAEAMESFHSIEKEEEEEAVEEVDRLFEIAFFLV
jgi:hypothetical protein